MTSPTAPEEIPTGDDLSQVLMRQAAQPEAMGKRARVRPCPSSAISVPTRPSVCFRKVMGLMQQTALGNRPEEEAISLLNIQGKEGEGDREAIGPDSLLSPWPHSCREGSGGEDTELVQSFIKSAQDTRGLLVS